MTEASHQDRSVDALTALLYDQLRSLARERMAAGGAPQQTLQATALVHEVWLRLAQAGETLRFRDDGHFRATAARAMRWILVDHARRRLAQRRSGRRDAAAPDPDQVAAGPADDRLLALDEALQGLAAEAPRKASVVELRHFGGLSVEECAAALDVSPATVKREWQFARAWLQARLGDAEDGAAGCS